MENISNITQENNINLSKSPSRPHKVLLSKARHYTLIERRRLMQLQLLYVGLSYLLLIAYGYNLINTWILVLTFSLYYLRLFDVLHQKSHANERVKMKPKWLDSAIDYFNIFYLPYHESSRGKISKHKAHHRAHRTDSNGTTINDNRINPHAVFERQGFFKSFLAALFYEEVMLYLDTRDGKWNRERWITAIVGSIVMCSLILFLGVEKFLVFAIFYRVAFALSWFGFSYIFHHPGVYGARIENRLSKKTLKVLRFFIGAGSVNSIFYHEFHHLAPQVPAKYLHQLDPTNIS